MNTQNLFATLAFVCLLFGVALAFTPDYISNLFLTDPSWMNPAAKTLGQGYGSLLIAVAMAYWYGRKAAPSQSRQAMLLLLLLSNLALVAIHSLALVNHIETPAAWSIILLAVVISVWSGTLLMQESRAIA